MNHGVSSFQTVLLTILIVLSGCNQGSQQETTTSDSSTYSSNATSDQKIDFAEPKNREDSNSKEAGEKEPLSRENLIESAESEVNKGNFKSAEALLKTALVSEPNDVEVIFRLASVVAASGDLSSAIEYMEAIPADHPEAGLPALGQSADWCFELERFDDAETKSVELPVFCLAVEVGTTAWRGWSSQLDLNLLQVLHDWADEESTWALDDQLLDVVILEDFHRLSLGL